MFIGPHTVSPGLWRKDHVPRGQCWNSQVNSWVPEAVMAGHSHGVTCGNYCLHCELYQLLNR